ncbi:hypothetical protein AN958_03083 [Leucoagaricus sp. SymC.cos]|nr:hypothetical protein AN958_03083 [Leucoagaricus sp. SymC.cos]
MKALYPASNILDNLTSTQRALKIARHFPCSLCNNTCSGLQPSLGIKPVLDESPFQGLFGLGDYGSDDDDEANGPLSYLEFCQCGHDVKYHGANEAELGSNEFTRRARVAIRLDELIQDEGDLLDFECTNEDIESLRKQMTLWQPTGASQVNSTSSPETRSQPSNALSPASSILSDPSPTSPRAAKRRRLSYSSSLSDADDNDDDDDEQPLASRVASSSTTRPVSGRRSGKSRKGGKKNSAMKKKAHTAPTSLAPPVGDEQAQMNKRINGINGHEPKIKVEDKLDEGQLNRLAAGVPVDAARETGVRSKSISGHICEISLAYSHQSRLRRPR